MACMLETDLDERCHMVVVERVDHPLPIALGSDDATVLEKPQLVRDG